MTPSVTLIQPTDVSLFLTEPLTPSQLQSLRLQVDDQLEPLKLIEETPSEKGYAYVFQRARPLELGHGYFFVIEALGTFPMDMRAALSFPDFESTYTYPGHDLGSQFTSNQTTFKLWAPLASQVRLYLYQNPDQLIGIFPMIRETYGVYVYEHMGNADGFYYRYDITNNGLSQMTIDPYGKGSSVNGSYSVVIDFSRVDMQMHDEQLPSLISYQHAIIYETHIRDFTNDPATSIPHKGTFLGATARGHRLEDRHPVGFDYLASLGITHVQLLPVTDYATVHESATANSYNWGYDPYQYFALEGSLASKPEDPYNRILEFKSFVSACHQEGIRVNIDVVFNHVYEYQHSVFEKVVPGYYFRMLPNGTMSNGSFCGNDFASEKSMVRHLILEAAFYLVSTFHLDGFRFDLMGLLDLETLFELQQRVRILNPYFMLYGEGWDMPTHLPKHQKGITENANQMHQFAFFNDAFRNVIKGGNFSHDLHEPGYATGQIGYANLLPFLATGSCRDDLGHPKVPYAYQSINYVECHDNHTFYDKLLVSNPDENLQLRYRRIRFANALVTFAAGIPFFHRGQEVGGTKLGDHNSYRSGDRINTLDYRLISERWPLVESFQTLLAIRKEFLALSSNHGWSHDLVTWQALDHGAWVMTFKFDIPHLILWNPSLHQVQLPDTLLLQHYHLMYDGEQRRDQPLTLTHVPPISCLILKQR